MIEGKLLHGPTDTYFYINVTSCWNPDDTRLTGPFWPEKSNNIQKFYK